MPTYNGHKNRNHWNVSLWIANDEGLYRMAKEYLRRSRTKDEAARGMLDALRRFNNTTHTPDGAPYTFTSIRAAMRGWGSHAR